MTYSQQTWTNNDPATPVSAARLTHIEAGIGANDTAITALQNAPPGKQVAGPVVNSSAIEALVGTTEVATGLSITVPTLTQPFKLIWQIPLIQGSTGTSANGSTVNISVFVCDSTNAHVAGGARSVSLTQVGSVAMAVQVSLTIVTHHLAAASNASYHLQHKQVAATPANWTSCKINGSASTDYQISVAAIAC